MSVSLLQLWMPILVGSVLAWIASILLHVVLPFHKSDYKQLPHEEDIADAIRKGSPGVGLYTFPFCSDMKEMSSESTIAKFDKGPVGMLIMFPNGMPNMVKLIGMQVGFFIVGSILVAYCATLTIGPGADYMTVFRIVSAVAFLAFGWAQIPFSIWYGHPWSITFKYLVDALIYGLLIAGAFSWLWPAAA